MATATIQQPDLRAYIVLPKVPEDCLSFMVPDDRMEPFLHAGDIAIIDPADREPDQGDLFLIQWNDGGRQVVEIKRHPKPENIVGWDGTTDYWQACWGMTMRSLGGENEVTMRWGDGPYSTFHLTDKLVGRVVGLLQPAFVEPLRIAA